MARLREDGSVVSSNDPTWENRESVLDFGMYRGVITDVFYTDSDENITKNEANSEVTYEIIIIGGERDGQTLSNVRKMELFGSPNFYTEHVLKKTITSAGLEIANPLNLADTTDTLNGDHVYIQFLNGNPYYPIIIGCAKHTLNTEPGATEDEATRFKSSFNGITTEIDKEGVFTWTKANGTFFPGAPIPIPGKGTGVPGPDGKIYNDGFLPVVPEAVSITLGNEYNFEFKYNLGLSLTIDGLADTFGLNTTAGAALTLDGIADTFSVTTLVGTALTVAGTSDSIELVTAVGTQGKIDGLSDKISFSAAFGDSLEISAADGIQASTPTGTSLSMKQAEVILSSGTATLRLLPSGQVALGNSGVELLDLLVQLLQALSTDTYAGFNAPASNVATYAQLLAQFQTLKGSL